SFVCACLLHHFCAVLLFNATATSDLYTLSLHDALPIFLHLSADRGRDIRQDLLSLILCVSLDLPFLVQLSLRGKQSHLHGCSAKDRKSTRLNSSHVSISYAVFCLKKKNKPVSQTTRKTT